jgi:hypothetical protein
MSCLKLEQTPLNIPSELNKKLYITEYNYMLVWKQSKNGPYQIRAAMWNLKKNPCAQ